MKKILLILTGGTICSIADKQGKNRDIDMEESRTLLLENFQNSGSRFAKKEFEVVTALCVLSENMTLKRWNELLDFFKRLSFVDYEGILIAHGTDTLSYMSYLVALLFSNIPVPVFLVSSDHPLEEKRANGNIHFQKSVELIGDGIRNGAYVVYRNEAQGFLLHKAGHLEACGDYSNDFYSRDAISPEGKSIEEINHWAQNTDTNPLEMEKVASLTESVLFIKPYVGLDYQRIYLTDSIKAVVHGLYHSATACVGENHGRQETETTSILWLLQECGKRKIPVIITPAREDALYVSGSQMIQAGAIPVYGMTTEMVYVKTVLGIAMGLEGERLIEFLRRNVCGEYFTNV